MSARAIRLMGVLLIVALASGCATQAPVGPKEEEGTVGGAVLGGLIGAIIGNNVGDGENQALGAAIGALLGGTAGSDYGRSQDQIDGRIAGLEQRLNTEQVKVENDNGSFTTVTVVKLPDGTYLGPRREIYSELPTQEQLKPVYGLKY